MIESHLGVRNVNIAVGNIYFTCLAVDFIIGHPAVVQFTAATEFRS